MARHSLSDQIHRRQREAEQHALSAHEIFTETLKAAAASDHGRFLAARDRLNSALNRAYISYKSAAISLERLKNGEVA